MAGAAESLGQEEEGEGSITRNYPDRNETTWDMEREKRTMM